MSLSQPGPGDGRRTLTHRTISGMVWMAIGKAAYAGLQLVVLAVLARLVSPTDFGVVSAALVVIGFSAIVSQLGIGPALVQRAELEPRHIDTGFTVSVLFGLLLGAVIWLGAPAAAEFFRTSGVAPVLRALAWVFPLQGLGVVGDSLARRELKFRWLALIDVKAYGLGYGLVGITLAFAGWGVWALVAAEITEALARTALLLASRPPRLVPVLERRALSELMYFGSGFTVAKIAHFFAVNGDNLLVGRMLGPTALGLYGRAYQLMAAPAASLGNVVDNVLFPAMARVQHQATRLATAYRRSVTLTGVAVLPASAVLFVLAPEFIETVLGARWRGVTLPFQILAAGMVLHTSSKMSDSLVRATGAVYRRAWRQSVFAAMVLGGAWVGQRWGIAGVAWAVLIAHATNFLLMAHLSVQVSELHWGRFWLAYRPGVALTAVAAPVAWGVATLLRNAAHGPLVVLAVASAAALAATTLVVWPFATALLGPDVLWMVETLRGYAAPLRGSRGTPPGPASVPPPQAQEAGGVS